ncbi:hypothetical protein POM88_040482 [Heracleum sosnowskyi]|uniref:Mitochondrial glycoprotein n=1 Tax=Heracleum sosnowskyi TaxID=360622 RepID=A0AAD8M8U9_9APIA|nr:hypothetical protein POM88_040482 [Heracleum sosnowskyi]
MALHSILQRSAARITPIAARFVTAGERYYHNRTPAMYSFAKFQPSNSLVIPTDRLSSLRRRYSAASSSALKTTTCTGCDRKLLKIIDFEIYWAEDDEDDFEDVDPPESFPFKIHEDNHGKQTTTLSRMYQGETVSVEVDLHIDDPDDYAKAHGLDYSYSMSLIVRVLAKSEKYILEFGCTTYPEKILINSLSVKNLDSVEDKSAYEGRDLDDDLQKAFEKYLEARGINNCSTKIFFEYQIRKRKRVYSNHLQKLKKFVQA